MTRRICVVTGARSDYGLLRWVIQGIQNDSDLSLQIIATGMHLAPEFGLTYREIEHDGFKLDRTVEMLVSSDTPEGIAKSMGLGLIGFGDALNQLQPDLMVVLGDRFEIFVAVAAALIARIPVAHLHGGETSEGAFDEALRHSITKMSHLHFVAAESYRQRVVQLGEHPERVFLVGGLGVDNVKRLKLLGRSELERALDFELGPRNLLVTFHPVTLDKVPATVQMAELLAALDEQKDTKFIITLPAADTGSRALIAMTHQFTTRHTNARAYPSLGQVRYLSAMAHADGVVGNSSSGLIEAPALQKGTVNIGDRQRGRLQASSVINCEPSRRSIAAALEKLYSAEFQAGLSSVSNPYGAGGASEKVVEILKHHSLDGITKKVFHDLSVA